MGRRETKLYDVVLPIWLLWLLPRSLAVVIPVIFLLDFLVLFFEMKHLGIGGRREKLRTMLWKTWTLGLLGDLAGAAFLFLATEVPTNLKTGFGRWWYHYLTEPLSVNPFHSVFSIFWAAAAVLLAGMAIYVFNWKVAFAKLKIQEEKKRQLAVSLALFTAPYLFLLPSSLLYR